MSKKEQKIAKQAELSPKERTFFWYYFLIHIPITIFIDASVIIPSNWQVGSTIVSWHIQQNNDFLLWEKPLWLKICVFFELVSQLPLFFYFLKRLNEKYYENARLIDRKRLNKWLFRYGLIASATTFYCLYEIAKRGHYPFLGSDETLVPLSNADKLKLIGVYLPTFLIPLRLLLL
ncbi:Ema19p NDAI_0C06360 [Naumovozyma dairenensis CBS 421]|uniref:Efficient mitochondria targeting-associated protein 19 n=1 Tax=Naumovozyma dairenensis (strain ATCC 10597 / BCRC 20456 / CBS 421 / NBRC 0211 / NRRL Y-12639) TaxID=1071378 RepID=G0W934_NAUDC|nr:hypothetical protein NDAI_0C06360 [Naumovozyma dairenensis CBS 421]CCD24295.1 hypothetical protein NDAI_0C06360 [Naumovozyma dairenensis CBS 421]